MRRLPNIDRIGSEGALFTHYYAEQSCTAGRNAFFTGMHPLRTGMIPPQLPGSPSYLRPGTPAVAKLLLNLGYNTGEFGKNHLGDHTDALPTAHGFQEFWGYLYNAGRELPRHQQDHDPADHRAAVHEHADPGTWPECPARWNYKNIALPHGLHAPCCRAAPPTALPPIKRARTKAH